LATSKVNRGFSRSGLWQLYTATAFLMHVWAIILILMDVSWVAERTDFWDAIGVAAYGLMFIFFESLIIFFVLVLVGFIFPRSWSEAKRITLLGVLIVVILIWAILGQLYFLLGISLGPEVIYFLASNPHPLWIIYGTLLIVVTPTVALPAFATIRSEKFQQGFLAVLDRLSVLMGLYILLDFASIVIVLIRNLG